VEITNVYASGLDIFWSGLSFFVLSPKNLVVEYSPRNERIVDVAMEYFKSQEYVVG
jgi:hypothetical protein